MSIACPTCKGATKCMETRSLAGLVRRQYRCKACSARFWTSERIEMPEKGFNVRDLKRDGRMHNVPPAKRAKAPEEPLVMSYKLPS